MSNPVSDLGTDKRKYGSSAITERHGEAIFPHRLVEINDKKERKGRKYRLVTQISEESRQCD